MVNAIACTIEFFTIYAEILARSLANFYRQYADRHMNLKFVRHVSERERGIRPFANNNNNNNNNKTYIAPISILLFSSALKK